MTRELLISAAVVLHAPCREGSGSMHPKMAAGCELGRTALLDCTCAISDLMSGKKQLTNMRQSCRRRRHGLRKRRLDPRAQHGNERFAVAPCEVQLRGQQHERHG